MALQASQVDGARDETKGRTLNVRGRPKRELDGFTLTLALHSVQIGVRTSVWFAHSCSEGRLTCARAQRLCHAAKGKNATLASAEPAEPSMRVRPLGFVTFVAKPTASLWRPRMRVNTGTSRQRRRRKRASSVRIDFAAKGRYLVLLHRPSSCAYIDFSLISEPVFHVAISKGSFKN